MATTAPALLVQSTAALLACLRRIHTAEDALCYTTEHDLRICIRHDPEYADSRTNTLGFQVCLVGDEDELIERVAGNEIDLYDDGDGCFVIKDYCFDETDERSLAQAMALLNGIQSWRVCPCGDRLVKDGHPLMCYVCEMTMGAEDRTTETTCPICHECGYDRWMATMACCKQSMHRVCRNTCLKNDPRCPLCRAAAIV